MFLQIPTSVCGCFEVTAVYWFFITVSFMSHSRTGRLLFSGFLFVFVPSVFGNKEMLFISYCMMLVKTYIASHKTLIILNIFIRPRRWLYHQNTWWLLLIRKLKSTFDSYFTLLTPIASYKLNSIFKR